MHLYMQTLYFVPYKQEIVLHKKENTFKKIRNMGYVQHIELQKTFFFLSIHSLMQNNYINFPHVSNLHSIFSLLTGLAFSKGILKFQKIERRGTTG